MKIHIPLFLVAAVASMASGDLPLPMEKNGQCFCPTSWNSRDGTASAPLIFAGEVTQVSISTSILNPPPYAGVVTGPPLSVKHVFTIHEIWKGPPSPDVHVYTSTGPCGVKLSQGTSYLVFAYRDPFDTDENGYWTTNRCMTITSTSTTNPLRQSLGPPSTIEDLSFISLKRSAGFSDLPDYDLTLMKSGVVFFRDHRSPNSVTLSTSIDHSTFARLIVKINQSGFFNSWPLFEEGLTGRFDCPRALICAASNGRYRCLERDDVPDANPQAFLDLANDIDRGARVKQWFHEVER